MTTVFFDMETGGLADHAPIIQLAAVAMSRGREAGAFIANVQFNEADADPEALALNHYDPALWANAQPLQFALSGFAAFLGRFPEIRMVSKRTGQPYRVARLAGHNASRFDGPRLFSAARSVDVFIPADLRVLDTCQLALWLSLRGDPPADYNLGTLCALYGVALTEAHDALADCRATAQLARVMLRALFAETDRPVRYDEPRTEDSLRATGHEDGGTDE